MRKPNFFIVGEAKTGSTALYYQLKQHPDIFMPEVKEPNYFCKDFLQESEAFYNKNFFNRLFKDVFLVRTEKRYLRLFKNWNNEKIAGDATVKNLYSKVAAKEIHTFNPNANILILLREPVDFVHSLHSQHLYTGTENIADFKRALALEGERKHGKYPPTTRFSPPSLRYYSERIKYAENVKRYLDLFGDHVKVVLYEDFKKDNANIYKEICTFLGVDANFTPTYTFTNHSKNIKNRALNTFVHSPLFHYLVFPLKLLPLPTRRALRKRVFRAIATPTKRQPLDPTFRKELMRTYKPEVEKISALLGKDLVKKWGYNKI